MHHNSVREHQKEKTRLHPRNRHRERYDFKLLIESCPQLAPFVFVNIYQEESIDFFNPDAVKMLNKALLRHYYNIDYWDIPPNYLCPPIPGRADYIHHVADLLCSSNNGIIPTQEKINCLDIGVGANCVYPIIGHKEYGWSFVGSDIDPVSIESAKKIIDLNSFFVGKIDIRLQNNPRDIFIGIIKQGELFDITICNPPFHASPEEARLGAMRKLTNLQHKKCNRPILNFGGQNNELWCKGGETRFVKEMICQSKQFASSCFWFSTSISRQSSLNSIYNDLKNAEAAEIKTIPMSQGNKTSRIVAWTFLSQEQQKKWIKLRWNAK